MTQQPSLNPFRQRLRKLAEGRRAARWASGIVIALCTLLWLLGLVMLIDVTFQLDRLQRVTVLSMLGATWGWLLYRHALPYFTRRESEVELALLLERNHGIDTDLVAAIEFAGAGAASWGSATLRGKVISDVAQLSGDLDVRRGMDDTRVRRHFGALGATAILIALVVGLFPQHTSVFLRRLALGRDHYPSRTTIAEIAVNGQPVYAPQQGAAPRDIRCAEQSPIEIRVRCTRHAPELGELRILSSPGGDNRRVTLHRQEDHEVTGTVFTARLPALLETLEYQIYLGDAWTDPARIEMVPLPRIELRASITPPAYTNADPQAGTSQGSYRLTAIEGSRVELAIVSVNRKPLESVEIELQLDNATLSEKLIDATGGGTRWSLPTATVPALASLKRPVRFAVTAVDIDGLRPPQPLSGELRVQSDMPPEAAAATIHRLVLPAARPQIDYRVNDDFGIARLRWRLQIERREPPSVGSADGPARPVEACWLEIDNAPVPIPSAALPYRDRYQLELDRWELREGDRIRLMLEATDHRGPAAGDSALSKPLYLEVSDRAGVLEAILEADRRTEQNLDQMIERQLGLEDLP